MIPNDDIVINQTIEWIKSVVIANNFCPFANKAIMQNSIKYIVLQGATMESCINELNKEFLYLDTHEDIETTFIIFSDAYSVFEDYLDVYDVANEELIAKDYEGIYQIASFHPDYCFEGSDENDPANYTNRSIYPMLHLLREASITRAMINFPHIESIPTNNIAFAREKGLQYMQVLRNACMK